jgi:mannose-6-phosphate isomerase
MERITGARKDYHWGSPEAICEFLGVPSSASPLAEVWFGTHPSGPAQLPDGRSLRDAVDADPHGSLGADVITAFGERLPFLVKLLAPASPVSLQVHPSLEQAQAGFADEEARGVPREAAHRTYPDANHKPEMLFALTTCEAVAGFRPPRRAIELLASLDAPLARTLHADLVADPSPDGVRTAFSRLLDPAQRPGADAVAAVVEACAARLAAHRSPSVRTDRIVAILADAYPGDPGAVASLLMNPVTLRPGEVLFVPAGGVHSYLSGLAIEVLANSDNVLRAGLTSKYVDAAGVLETVDWVAAPPVRLGPERVADDIDVFYAPVDDFQLSVATVDHARTPLLPGRGPRVVIVIDGEVELSCAAGGRARLHRGEALFVTAADGEVTLAGSGTVAQASVP